jgi:phosphoribosylformimino-5-aminoimidazole carboxamide ribotide isomerase
MDLKTGVVVRGVGGRRDEYRPIVSRLTTSARPLDIARAFRQHFQLTELYLADLDAIAGAPPNWDVYHELLGDGFQLLVDAGVRDQWQALNLSRAGVPQIVVGLETLLGPEELLAITGALGSGSVLFSLDLKEGLPLGNREAWEHAGPLQIVAEVIAMRCRRLLVLDLASVGSGQGTPTAELCRTIHERHPQVEIITGGGVRSMVDVESLGGCGVSGVLVASALHDGGIGGIA